MSVTVNGSTGLTFNDGTSQSTSAFYGGLALRNRIINGAMMIDQRNAGASVATAISYVYPLDRFRVGYGSGGVITTQQSTTVPTGAGFVNSLSATVTTTDNLATAGDYYGVIQNIEGLNCADLMWGTANAKTVTVSFWVRSSITGTYTVTISNSAGNRSYPATYTISAANTWEQKSITIAGDTSGTWLTTNGTGIVVAWNLGGGSDYTSGTANAWNASGYLMTSGQTPWISTSGATFYITGVQLEKGSTATSFDYRPYGTELSLCQRYYFRNIASNYTAFMAGFMDSTSSAFVRCDLPTTMRANPTFTQSGNALYRPGTAISIGAITNRCCPTSGSILIATASAVAGDGCRLESDVGAGANGYVEFSAEL